MAAVAGVVGAAGGGLGYAARELLHRQAETARRIIGKPLGEQAPDADRVWKPSYGNPVDLLLLGDSIAAGLGADIRKETLGGRLSKALATTLHRSVRLRTGAVVGSESSMLAGQIDALPGDYAADVAVIVVGGNDVTHRVPVTDSVKHLEEAIARLRERGTAVVVGTCPDLGTIKPIAPPLKQVARAWSRRLAAAQTIAVIEEGGRTVSLGSILGPEFAAAPALLFGPDQFHPSAEGYRSLAGVMVPSVLAAIGVIEPDEKSLESLRGEGVLPISDAAIRAVQVPGTELDGTEVGGSRRGVRGLWVELRHRRRRPDSAEETPDESDEQATDDVESAEASEEPAEPLDD